MPVTELPDTAPWTQVAANMDYERYPLDYLRYWKRLKILLSNGSVVVGENDGDEEEGKKSDEAASKRQRSSRQNNSKVLHICTYHVGRYMNIYELDCPVISHALGIYLLTWNYNFINLNHHILILMRTINPCIYVTVKIVFIRGIERSLNKYSYFCL